MKRAGGDPIITLGLPPEVPTRLADDLMLSVAQVYHIREYHHIIIGTSRSGDYSVQTPRTNHVLVKFSLSKDKRRNSPLLSSACDRIVAVVSLQQCLSFLSRCVGRRQVNAYREAFRLFDEDGSGELDSAELGFVIRSIGFQVCFHVLPLAPITARPLHARAQLTHSVTNTD